jgi:hypothetical protein
MSTPDPAPATTDSNTTSKPAPTISLDSLKAMIPGTSAAPSKPVGEGPDILPSNPQTDTTPPPGDNSAPPPIPVIPAPKKEISLQEILMGILFLVLSVAGIYFGFTLGLEEGRGYLLFVQSFGPWIRGWFTSRHATPSVYDIKK